MSGPAEVFRLAEYLVEELTERGWKTGDLAMRMPGEYGVNLLCVELLLAVDDDSLKIDDETFDGMAAAFGVSGDLFRNLDRLWREWPDRRSPFNVPESIFTGGVTPPVH